MKTCIYIPASGHFAFVYFTYTALLPFQSSHLLNSFNQQYSLVVGADVGDDVAFVTSQKYNTDTKTNEIDIFLL